VEELVLSAVEDNGVTNVRQTEAGLQKAEPSVPEPGSFEVEIAIKKLKR
jgi:hypothetical protein